MKSTNIASKKVAEILLDIGAVLFSRNKPFKFDSGILSPVYTDNRLVISHPKEREKIIAFFISTIKEIGIPDVIAGTATAGIPHAAFIAQKLKKMATAVIKIIGKRVNVHRINFEFTHGVS